MLIYVPHVVCVYECVHVSKILLIVCGSAWWGRERERCWGRGEIFPQLFNIQNCKRDSLASLSSPPLPSPPFSSHSGLAEATSRIMMLLFSAPPLGGSVVAMVGPP